MDVQPLFDAAKTLTDKEIKTIITQEECELTANRDNNVMTVVDLLMDYGNEPGVKGLCRDDNLEIFNVE